MIMMALMLIGASPGSTGGGVKTTTFYALIKSLISTATGREARSFGRKLKDDTMHRAFIIISLAFTWLLVQTTLMSVFDPHIPLRDILFEMVSGLSTTGLTTGITPMLSTPSKIILLVTMYAGRLGPLTIATLWVAEKRSDVSRPEEDLPIG